MNAVPWKEKLLYIRLMPGGNPLKITKLNQRLIWPYMHIKNSQIARQFDQQEYFVVETKSS